MNEPMNDAANTPKHDPLFLDGRYVITELRDVHVTGGTSHTMVTLSWEARGFDDRFYDTGQVAYVPVSAAQGKLLRLGARFAIGVQEG